MKHFMLDLETLGTNRDAVIVAIGACVLDARTGDISASFYAVCDIQDQYRSGRSITADTLLWWIKQDDAARAVFSAETQTLDSVLGNLCTHIETAKPDLFWANGITFDYPIIEHALQTHDYRIPWSYSKVACLRTLRKTMPSLAADAWKHRGPGIAHNALSDAVMQARELHYFLTRMPA
jgi:hypothetical protein